jgi:hypothetical protein
VALSTIKPNQIRNHENGIHEFKLIHSNLLRFIYSCLFAGYNGKGIDIDSGHLSLVEKQKYDEGWKRNAFNQYASDLIPVNRYTGDYRHQL